MVQPISPAAGLFSLFNRGDAVVAAGLQTVAEVKDIDRGDLRLLVKLRDEQPPAGTSRNRKTRGHHLLEGHQLWVDFCRYTSSEGGSFIRRENLCDYSGNGLRYRKS